jgi:putative membrane protein insertion efficiency factor
MTLKTKKIIITNWENTEFRLKLIIACFFMIVLPFKGINQENNGYNLTQIKGLFEVHEHKAPKFISENQKPKNELEFLMATGFNVYKAFFSSQDNPSCVFHPSCSEYSVEALQQKGLLLGTLYTFDRLSRCHRLVKPGQYVFDPSKQRFYDPIR